MRKDYSFLLFFAGALLLASFLFNTPMEILEGSIIILKSPANLITDYFMIANAGAALFNAAVMTLISIAILWTNRIQLNGLYIAVIFTVAGFSLFGKNLYNSIPIIFGVCLYSRLRRQDIKKCLPVALFGTALGPLVSEITFNLNVPLQIGVPLGILSGMVAGFIMYPLSEHFKQFHKGYSLYNVGFTAGFIGAFFIAILRSFNIKIETVHLVSEGHNETFIYFLAFLFLTTFLWGLALNQWSLRGYARLLKLRVEDRDFILCSGFGVTLINMSLLGILATLYVVLVGGQLNGPIIGGIFTVVGFGAFGKHIRNVVPIVLGVYLMGCFSFQNVAATSILLAALFGTTLAPISQAYGPIIGIIAGALHVTLAVNISYLHGGMNLYNNGFSGGFVAAALVPLLQSIAQRKTAKNTQLEIKKQDTTSL